MSLIATAVSQGRKTPLAVTYSCTPLTCQSTDTYSIHPPSGLVRL